MKTPQAVKLQHLWLPHWLCARGHPMTDGRTGLKLALAAEGVNARGLRLYLDYGDRLFAPLSPHLVQPADTLGSARSALGYLRLLQGCEMDLAPPEWLVRAIVESRLAALDTPLVALFRAAWRAYSQIEYAGMSVKPWLADECIPLLQWVWSQQGDAAAPNALHKLTWGRLRARWQDDLQERALPHCPREWQPPLGYVATADRLLWVPLAASAALQDEGAVMSHCVANYTDACRIGEYAVYSLRQLPSRHRIATLGLERNGGRLWSIDQIKGRHNAIPDPAIRRAADVFMQRLQAGPRMPDDALEDADWCNEARSKHPVAGKPRSPGRRS